MTENNTFTAIRERFENSLQITENVSYQMQSGASLWYSPNKSVKIMKRIPATSSGGMFPEKQQRLIIGKEYDYQRLENKDKALELMTNSLSVQPYQYVQSQTDAKVKSFTEQIQDKASTLRRRPAVPEKPKSKFDECRNTNAVNELSMKITPPLQKTDFLNVKAKVLDVKSRRLPLSSKSSSEQMILAENQISSVINLRQQFEEKHINLKSQRFENRNISQSAPTSTPKLFESCVEKKMFRGNLHEIKVNENTWVASENSRQQWTFVPNEQQNIKTPQFESRSLPRPGRNTQMKFNSSFRGVTCQYKDVSCNLPQSTPTAEASNLKVITSFADEEVYSDDEFDDDDVVLDEPIYANYIANSVTNDLPKLPLQVSRQRTSYAEPRIRPELKSSMSFSPNDVKTNSHGKKEANKKLQLIITELIKSENDYVQNLLKGIKNYENIFMRRDLPRGLSGKEFDLFGNIKQIALFHRDVLLPMLIANEFDLSKLFTEFLFLLDNHRMYEYVLYTMNKRRSLKICNDFAPYFTYLQEELGEQLGIDDFLLQPIQRLPRYKMLFQNLLSPLFKAQDKVAIASCCRLEKKIGALLNTVNEADLICDLAKRSDLNIYNSENKFRKALELVVYDSDRSICYSTKVFIFDKCIIYAEIKDNDLIFRGCFDACKQINLSLQKNSFSLSYLRPKMQECIFHGEPQNIQCCLEFIDEMIQKNLKQDSNQKYYNSQREGPYRISNDSGLGNMWTLPEESEL